MADDFSQAPVGTDPAEVQLAVDRALKEQKKKKKKKKLIIFGVILLVIILIAVLGSRPESYDFDNPAASVTVDTIINDFNKDTSSASEKYSGKVIAVTGQVGSIQDGYAALRSYDDDNWLYDVNVYFESNEDLGKFKVGDTITVEGVCDNTTLLGDVKVQKCVLADKYAVIPDYENAVQISAADFVKAYKENQVSADEKFKGKTVEITAKVVNVTDDYAVIEPENADVWDWDCDIQICFEDVENLKKVSEGSQVTVIGECYGKAAVYTAKLCRAVVK